MSIYIDSIGQLHHDTTAGLALTCPHCQVVAHLTPVSVPHFSSVVIHKPSHVGVVYRCDACNSPVFIKYPVKIYGNNRIELGNQYIELEHAREKFSYAHLPDACERLFKEALACYSHDAFNAFASMCRRTAQSMFKDLGENGRLKIFDLLSEVRDLAELDNDSFTLARKILFDSDAEAEDIPSLDGRHAGMLLEIMKDLLYQCYIRRGKLQQAMRMRRFFADERTHYNVTPLKAAP
ncbi:MAG: hypothetical protein AB7T07_00730 [Steroidobacteraceae bacterium]